MIEAPFGGNNGVGMSQQVVEIAKGGPGNWWMPRRWAVSLAALVVFLVGVTLLTYALTRSREVLTLHSLAESDAIAFTNRFQTEIDEHLRAFRRMKWNYIGGRYKKPEELRAASIEFQQTNPFCLP